MPMYWEMKIYTIKQMLVEMLLKDFAKPIDEDELYNTLVEFL